MTEKMGTQFVETHQLTHHLLLLCLYYSVSKQVSFVVESASATTAKTTEVRRP